MSNASTPPRQTGDPKRRRSRGGKNRQHSHSDGRHGGKEDFPRNGTTPRAEEFRPRSDGKQAPAAKPKLTFWQKLLKMLGLYKEPTRPARPERNTERSPERNSEPHKPKGDPRPAKSNTRNARTQGREDQPERSAESRPPRREKSERPRGGDRSTVESTRVYVGNLSYDVTEQDLQELFKGLGPVRNVEVVYNRATHRSKGYGFVEMLHKDEAMRAVEVFNDQFFMGRKLIVSGAKSKGLDEREELEDRPSRPAKPVELAPLPSPHAAEAPAPVAAVSAPIADPTEPTIQTIVETIPAVCATPDQEPAAAAEAPACAVVAEESTAPTEEESPVRAS